MNHLAFEDKLRAIQPFTDTLSPRSQQTQLTETTKQELQIQRNLSDYKVTDPQHFLEEVASLRKINSEQVVPQEEEIGESNRKTMSSISSTIDILFSKIQKIKEEFSFALHKPSSETEQFSEEKSNISQPDSKNKENQVPINNLSHSKSNAIEARLHRESKPLEAHNRNKNSKEIQNYVYPKFYYQPLNIFKPWEQQKPTQGLRIRDFHLGKCIGSGKFGDVFMSQHKQTGFMCAIKKILKSTLIEYNMVDQFIKELKIHYGLNHPNVIKLYTHFQDEYHIFLMMELAQKSLIETLAIGQEETSKVVDQVTDALVYIHRNKVIHRDLKPENIVTIMGVPKVCDFGWAAIQDNVMHQTFCGTLDYVSPQMKDTGQYNESIDLWSIGVLTFQLIAGFPPFKQEISTWKMKGSKRKIRWSWQVIYPPQIRTEAQNFIDSLLQVNPIERASLPECKSHPFLTNTRGQLEKREEQLQLDRLFQ